MRWIVIFLASICVSNASAAPYDVVEKSIATLDADMASGRVTSEELVRAYLARIDAIDKNGPALHSVIAINPDALSEARALDAERKAKGPRGPLHGIPILIKDNIETADPMPTTAGSLVLADNVTRRDAPIVARLRAAGAVILGKTNLSEWANIRSSRSISGWSAIGGLTKNPYVLDRSPCGSSAGSAVVVAASLAAAAIGTETDGSLVCPGSINGIVALKPTVGLLSRTHIVPISHSQDTPGPMTRSVADAAILLSVVAGSDPADPATAEADARKADYSLKPSGYPGGTLKGARLAVVMPELGPDPVDSEEVFANAIHVLKAAGADVVAIKNFAAPSELRRDELTVLTYELKHDLNAYFAGLPERTKPLTLASVIAFNDSAPREHALFGQDIFRQSQSLGDLSDPAYVGARDRLRASSRKMLDTIFAENHADALVEITTDPSWRIDITPRGGAGHSASFLPATSGYPHLTVPLGYVNGLPFGISFIGPAWSEAKLLAFGRAFEEIYPARRPPNFIPSLESTPNIAKAFGPVGK